MIDKFKDNNEIDIANQYSQVWDIVVDILRSNCRNNGWWKHNFR